MRLAAEWALQRPGGDLRYLQLGTSTGGRPRVRLRSVRSAGRARWEAGITWTSRTLAAQWAGRYGHTSVIDAAGAIYVIGGYSDGTLTYYQDMWASTDGGARPDCVKCTRGLC